MKNSEIYNISQNLVKAFDDNSQKFPIKVNFYLQKNKKTLLDLAQEIEGARMEIITTYGKPSPDNNGQYIIAPENVESAQKELNDLFDLEQDVNIYKLSIDNFPEDMSLTGNQMEALLFMIE